MGIRRYNPISDKRLALLHRQARKALEKNTKRQVWELRQREPYASMAEDVLQAVIREEFARMEIAWATLEPKLQHLGDADPTPSGSYSKWILDLLLKENIDLPEDAGKLRDILENYHRVKPRLPLDQRQIKFFNTYQHLREVLIPLLPELRSRSELTREGTKLIAREEINEALYELYQLTTVEATTQAAKNTGWCVCEASTARSYLRRGLLFLIQRNGERHVLSHIDYDTDSQTYDIDSIQVMNVDDVPLHPRNAEDRYQDIVEIFCKHLPMLLCPEHTEGNIAFKPARRCLHGKRATIYNLECEQCNNCGCYVNFALCKGGVDESCMEAACSEHATVCDECDMFACSDHSYDCCEHTHRCEEHARMCEDCGEPVCEECGIFVECCQAFVCNEHTTYCEECNSVTCHSHHGYNPCRLCDESSCDSCASEWPTPDCCDEPLCPSCYDYRCEDCDDCTAKVCPEHRNDCDADDCDKDALCPSCTHTCTQCGDNDTYCDLHRDSDNCTVCEQEWPLAKWRAHTHDLYHCGVPTSMDAGGIGHCLEPVCLSHRTLCHACEMVVCDKHREGCDCPPHTDWRGEPVESRHYYCPECITHNVCPVCQKTVCNPEDHMWCAYQRRRNPDENWRKIEREYRVDATPGNYIRLQRARQRAGLQNYIHYCQDCVFLGTDLEGSERFDYYHCTPHLQSQGSLIARYGNIDREYLSWPADILIPRMLAYQIATHEYAAPPQAARRVYQLALEAGTLQQP